MNEEKLLPTNKINEFLKYDFSELWLKTNNNLVYGILGDEYQRILIKLLTIEKNINNPNEYFVYGKSSVKENVCEFVGKCTILKSKRNVIGAITEFQVLIVILILVLENSMLQKNIIKKDGLI
jgi:hypothetical protein